MKMAELATRVGANRAVVALSAGRLGDALGNSVLLVVIPLYVARLPAPWLPMPESVRAGVLIAVYGIVSAAVQPLAGAWIDWSDRRKPFILAGLALMAAATLGFLLAGRYTELVLFRALQGVGLALTVPASLAVLASASEHATRGGSMGVYTSARMLGFTAGPLLGGALFDTLGFDAAFYLAAGFIAVAFVLVQRWVRDTRQAARRSTRGSFRLFDRRLLNSGLVGASLAVFAMAGSFSMMVALERQFNERLQQGAFAFGIAFSALMVSRLLLQVPLGWLSDRIGRKPVIIAGLLVMAPATWLLGDAQTTLELIGLRVVQGIGSAGIAAPAFALAADLASDGQTGRQMSLTTMGFGLGVAAGPLLAGVFAVFSFRLPFILMAALLVATAWVIHRYVPETVSRQAS